MALVVGARAPEFTLPAAAGGERRLSELRAASKHVIVAFYPKDNTSG